MRRTATTLILMVPLLASCLTPASADPRFELREFSIDGPTRISRGLSSVEAVNNGEYAHTLVVTTDMGTVIAATHLIGPGEAVVLPVDLEPGIYRFTCRIVAEADGVLVDHFEKGMNEVVRVVD